MIGSAVTKNPPAAVDSGEPPRRPAVDNRRRNPPSRPSGNRRTQALVDDRAAAAIAKAAKQADEASRWDEARTQYQRLEKYKGYRDMALYGQAWTAFQMNDAAVAAQIAGQLANEAGPYKIKAEFLHADALFRQADYKRAKEIYQKLRSELRGDQRAIAIKKIAACNKELHLPDGDGASD